MSIPTKDALPALLGAQVAQLMDALHVMRAINFSTQIVYKLARMEHLLLQMFVKLVQLAARLVQTQILAAAV
jgi:hypothetical protein